MEMRAGDTKMVSQYDAATDLWFSISVNGKPVTGKGPAAMLMDVVWESVLRDVMPTDSTRTTLVEKLQRKYLPEITLVLDSLSQANQSVNRGTGRNRLIVALKRPLLDLRTTLTPAQQAVFDKNVKKYEQGTNLLRVQATVSRHYGPRGSRAVPPSLSIGQLLSKASTIVAAVGPLVCGGADFPIPL